MFKKGKELTYSVEKWLTLDGLRGLPLVRSATDWLRPEGSPSKPNTRDFDFSIFETVLTQIRKNYLSCVPYLDSPKLTESSFPESLAMEPRQAVRFFVQMWVYLSVEHPTAISRDF